MTTERDRTPTAPESRPRLLAASGGTARRVALLIDWDNFHSQCAERGIAVHAARLKDRMRTIGQLRWSAVFVDVGNLTPEQRTDLFIAGFDICDCPKLVSKAARPKDTADFALIEKMHQTADFLPVDDVVLGSADRDYIRVIQAVRDRGKRVFILTPTCRDNPMVVQHSDGAISYVVAEADDEVLAEAKKLFDKGVYRSSEARVQAAFDFMAVLVQVLESRLQINRHQFGFRRVMDALRADPDIRASQIDDQDLRRRLEFLIECGVMGREKDDRRFYRYYVCPSHPFVVNAYGRPVQAFADPRGSASALS